MAHRHHPCQVEGEALRHRGQMIDPGADIGERGRPTAARNGAEAAVLEVPTPPIPGPSSPQPAASSGPWCTSPSRTHRGGGRPRPGRAPPRVAARRRSTGPRAGHGGGRTPGDDGPPPGTVLRPPGAGRRPSPAGRYIWRAVFSADLSPLARKLGSAAVHRAWAWVATVGCIGPDDARGRRYHAMGPGSCICFPRGRCSARAVSPSGPAA